MRLTHEFQPAEAHTSVLTVLPPARPASAPGYTVIRRNGTVTAFDATKISVALTKAFLAVEGTSSGASQRVRDIVQELTAQIVSALTQRAIDGRTFHIEDIQDQAELALMRAEHHKVARAYVLYREERAKARRASALPAATAEPLLHAIGTDGTARPLDLARLTLVVEEACVDLDGVSAAAVLAETRRNAGVSVPLNL